MASSMVIRSWMKDREEADKERMSRDSLPIEKCLDCIKGHFDCSICREPLDKPIQTQCGHVFCAACLNDLCSKPKASCPLCKKPISNRSLVSREDIGEMVGMMTNLQQVFATELERFFQLKDKKDRKRRSRSTTPSRTVVSSSKRLAIMEKDQDADDAGEVSVTVVKEDSRGNGKEKGSGSPKPSTSKGRRDSVKAKNSDNDLIDIEDLISPERKEELSAKRKSQTGSKEVVPYSKAEVGEQLMKQNYCIVSTGVIPQPLDLSTGSGRRKATEFEYKPVEHAIRFVTPLDLSMKKEKRKFEEMEETSTKKGEQRSVLASSKPSQVSRSPQRKKGKFNDYQEDKQKGQTEQFPGISQEDDDWVFRQVSTMPENSGKPRSGGKAGKGKLAAVKKSAPKAKEPVSKPEENDEDDDFLMDIAEEFSGKRKRGHGKQKSRSSSKESAASNSSKLENDKDDKLLMDSAEEFSGKRKRGKAKQKSRSSSKEPAATNSNKLENDEDDILFMDIPEEFSGKRKSVQAKQKSGSSSTKEHADSNKQDNDEEDILLMNIAEEFSETRKLGPANQMSKEPAASNKLENDGLLLNKAEEFSEMRKSGQVTETSGSSFKKPAVPVPNKQENDEEDILLMNAAEEYSGRLKSGHAKQTLFKKPVPSPNKQDDDEDDNFLMNIAEECSEMRKSGQVKQKSGSSSKESAASNQQDDEEDDNLLLELEMPENSGKLKSTKAAEPPAKPQRYVFCPTRLSKSQTIKLQELCKMSNGTITKDWKQDVTHLIINLNNGRVPQTLKYLLAIAGRKWVVIYDWVEECVAKKELVSEAEFETSNFQQCDPGVRRSRLSEKNLFDGFKFYFAVEIYKNLGFSRQDVIMLLETLGASVVDSPDRCYRDLLIIGACNGNLIEYNDWLHTNKWVTITFDWVIECILEYRLKPFEPKHLCIDTSSVKSINAPKSFQTAFGQYMTQRAQSMSPF